MLKSYLKIAIRNLLKQRGYTFINVFGLAIGMACCILIFLLIRYEWSYDTFHEKKDSIYSLFIQEKRTDGTLKFRRLIPLGIPKALAKEFPGVRGVVQLASGDVTMVHDGQAFREEIFEADSTFFNIFSFPLLAGDANSALSHPTNMVISETIAQKYFGQMSDGYQHVTGKTLSIRMGNRLQDFTVSGVMSNCPDNSSLQIDILIPFENYTDLPLGSNDVDGRTSTYLLLNERQHSFALEQALRPFTALHFKNCIETYQARGLLAAGDDAFQLRLQPLRELHRNPQIPVSYEEQAHNPMYSYILAGIGILVLLIACINFTTLSVARSASRAREVGMRKAVGAQKQQLMAQFWGEALMLSFFALLLGLAITAQSLPFFNYLTGKKLSLTGIQHGEVWLVLLGLMLIVGFITGTYPAVILSRFQPAIVLKGN
ncbi:ABC transporter permease, partial [candidate division KSB1 bacterium]|nr:ABC transporter permease [candidate division KSB1 bacterium]